LLFLAYFGGKLELSTLNSSHFRYLKVWKNTPKINKKIPHY